MEFHFLPTGTHTGRGVVGTHAEQPVVLEYAVTSVRADAVKVKLTVMLGTTPAWTDAVDLVTAASRERFVRLVQEKTGLTIPPDALLALMDACRPQASRRERGTAEPTPPPGPATPPAADPDALLRDAGGLLDDPRLLERIGEEITRGGYAGDVRAPLAIYLAATSRFLRRPVNTTLLGPSAAGKNATVAHGLRLIPPEDVFEVVVTCRKLSR